MNLDNSVGAAAYPIRTNDERMILRALTTDDLVAYHAHLRRHHAESGRDGDLIFSPFETANEQPIDVFCCDLSVKWQRPISEVGWERCWGLLDATEVVGVVKLVSSMPTPTALHRARLMMGIERPYRRQGLGRRLVEPALDWARAQVSLAWVELGVFAHNTPARRLYESLGFQEVGQVSDMFRVHGMKITDITMVLGLRDTQATKA